MPWANPVQKFSLAKLALLVGVTVQAPARSSAVLMFKLTGGAIGDWTAVAACIGAIQARAKLKTRMNLIEHLKIIDLGFCLGLSGGATANPSDRVPDGLGNHKAWRGT